MDQKHRQILHDNAWRHSSYKAIQKLNELKYEILHHPAFTLDLSPTNFQLLKHLEKFSQNKQYENEANLKDSMPGLIDSKDNRNCFRTSIHALTYRWEEYIGANGSYFD